MQQKLSRHETVATGSAAESVLGCLLLAFVLSFTESVTLYAAEPDRVLVKPGVGATVGTTPIALPIPDCIDEDTTTHTISMHSVIQRCPTGADKAYRRNAGSTHVCAAVKAKSARQVCCSKTLVAKPEHKEAVQQLCKEITEFSTARMKERSSGIQEFNCMVDGWEDNVVHFWERYDSNVTLGRHNTTPEVEAFMQKVVPLLERPVGMALYEYRNGQIGPLSVQIGPKGEGGLDDATGASGAAGGASYKQTSRATQLATVVVDDLPSTSNGSSSSSRTSGKAGSSDAAWWSWAGSQPAAVAAVVGAAAVLAVVGLKLTGH